MEMAPGRVTGLSGPNGSGKTMLMRAIVGLIRPTSGEVTVDGRDAWARGEGGRGWKDDGICVGLLLEGPAFLDGYTGYRNLELLASIRGTASREDIRASIEAMGLDPDDRRKYRKYSLGMKQRLGLAGAIMERPDVLVVDEPTNALDTQGVRCAVSQIKAAADRGATVVLACHDADVLHELSDEIWYLAEGHVDSHEVLRPATGGDAS
ncbi:MAG: ABC transporter ATP-binding protein [Coriobacteriia bacterium]|nr:ABC transporter ATP-binding protein [Coriobacteriia bacterium]MBS5478026.1 ABC transporter ATP-binding protein [Coriobacteriia bacterium]